MLNNNVGRVDTVENMKNQNQKRNVEFVSFMRSCPAFAVCFHAIFLLFSFLLFGSYREEGTSLRAGRVGTSIVSDIDFLFMEE
jgi:hypothetical protein